MLYTCKCKNYVVDISKSYGVELLQSKLSEMDYHLIMEAINYPPLATSNFSYCEIGMCMSFKVKSLCFKKENDYYKTFICSNCGTVCYLEINSDKPYYLMNMKELIEKNKIDSSKLSESFDIILYKEPSHEVKVQIDPHLEDIREEYLRKEKEAMENRIRIYVEQQEYLYRQKMEQSKKDLDLLTSQLSYDRSSFIRTVSDVTDASIKSEIYLNNMNITPIHISRPLTEKKKTSVMSSSLATTTGYSNRNKEIQQQKDNSGRIRSQSLPEAIFSKVNERHYLPAAVFGLDESDLSETESDNSDYDEDDDEDENEEVNEENEKKVCSLNIEPDVVSL